MIRHCAAADVRFKQKQKKTVSLFWFFTLPARFLLLLLLRFFFFPTFAAVVVVVVVSAFTVVVAVFETHVFRANMVTQ